jgi:hypothetical protein
VNRAADGIDAHLVDRMLELYCDWRTECEAVRAAYRRFSSAQPSERALAFAAYSAALEREGSASEAYEAQIRRISSRVGGGAHVRRR